MRSRALEQYEGRCDETAVLYYSRKVRFIVMVPEEQGEAIKDLHKTKVISTHSLTSSKIFETTVLGYLLHSCTGPNFKQSSLNKVYVFGKAAVALLEVSAGFVLCLTEHIEKEVQLNP